MVIYPVSTVQVLLLEQVEDREELPVVWYESLPYVISTLY